MYSFILLQRLFHYDLLNLFISRIILSVAKTYKSSIASKNIGKLFISQKQTMPKTMIQMPATHHSPRFGNNSSGGNSGINICCCRICTCINLEFLTTKSGLLKICELILATLCETLLVQFGLPYASDIGQAFISFLTTVSSCLATVTILLICYVLSAKSFQLIRQSLFVCTEKKIIFPLVFVFLCV